MSYIFFTHQNSIQSDNDTSTTLPVAYYSMPQALPFYFLNQGAFVLLTLAVLVYVVSVYVLPPILQLIVSRVYVTKL
jgi:hypothetical protein